MKISCHRRKCPYNYRQAWLRELFVIFQELREQPVGLNIWCYVLTREENDDIEKALFQG